MGLEEHLPSGVLLTSVENLFGYMRSAAFWPATFGLACCAIEMMTYGAALRLRALGAGSVSCLTSAGRSDDRRRSR
jgi:hypothetical protein